MKAMTKGTQVALGGHDFGQHKHQEVIIKPAKRVQEPVQQLALR